MLSVPLEVDGREEQLSVDDRVQLAVLAAMEFWALTRRGESSQQVRGQSAERAQNYYM